LVDSDRKVVTGDSFTITGVAPDEFVALFWNSPETTRQVRLDIVERPGSLTPPETEFEFEFAGGQEPRVLTITVAGGDSFDPTRVVFEGEGVPAVGRTWADQTDASGSVTTGDTVTLIRTAVTILGGGATQQGLQRLSTPILLGGAVPTHSSPYE
jgi:hypothetical protein